MKKRGSVLLLGISIVLALFAALFAVQAVKTFSGAVTAVVAAQELSPFEVVTQAKVKLSEVPAASVPGDAIRSLKELEGKYTRGYVLPGEVLRKGHLAGTGSDRSALSAKLTERKRPEVRAFALPFTAETCVGGALKEGDRVDVIASVKIGSGQQEVAFAKTVAQNVEVLKVCAPGDNIGKGALVLALTPQQVEDLSFALVNGTVRFALNPLSTDENAAKTPGVTGKAFLERYGFSTGG